MAILRTPRLFCKTKCNRFEQNCRALPERVLRGCFVKGNIPVDRDVGHAFGHKLGSSDREHARAATKTVGEGQE